MNGATTTGGYVDLDDLDLEILGRCLPGGQQFSLRASTDEQAGINNEWGDRLLALRDRGLLQFPDKLVLKFYGGGPSRYDKIGVVRVTAEGRRELKRREPPDPDVIQVIRAKIEADVEDRRSVFGAKYREITSQFGNHLSMMMQAVNELTDQEFRERGRILVQAWRVVLAAQRLLLTPRVAQTMKDDLGGLLDAQSKDVAEVFLKSPARQQGGQTQSELAAMRKSARRRIEAQIDYAALTPTLHTAPPPSPPSAGGTTHHNVFNLSGANTRVNIGSEDHSQNVVNITPPQLFAELRQAFETQVADIEERQHLLSRLEALEAAQNGPSFGQRYIDFMAAAASHATVIGPYLPALAQLFQPG